MNNTTPDDSAPVIGRFAPSPTGQLHFGSLITAIASYCDVKSQQKNGAQGTWLVRIEDTDWQRCQPEHSDHILKTLEAFGLQWDGTVIYQSQRLANYEHALEQLVKAHHAYACECSRKTLAQYADKHHHTPSHIYPRLCHNKGLDATDKNIRLVVPDTSIRFTDKVQGCIDINPQTTLGDMVLKRRDGIVNYILSSAVDDAAQGVTQVIRGLDLLELTPVQITLGQMLDLPQIQQHGHLPLALNVDGQKLSKQTKAQPIDRGSAPNMIQQVLSALKQPKVDLDKPDIMLAQAVSQWDIGVLQGQTKLGAHFS